MLPDKSNQARHDLEDRILWICPPYGIQYTNFNLADLDVYPGEIMKVFNYIPEHSQTAFLKKSIEVTEKGSGSVHIKSNVKHVPEEGIDVSSLKLNCVLEVPQINKIVNLGFDDYMNDQFLQVFDVVENSSRVFKIKDLTNSRFSSR